MATVTPNFNWPVPTSTDLVKDGATAMEALGDAIDTSMVDLKGGTTGQVLSKATSADMDFVWTDANPGDITGVTATSPLTGGGTSGTVTVGIQSASTTQLGAVQLSDSTSTTSSTLAATSTAVKSSYDLAAAAIPKSIVTTAGDVIYATGSGAVTRLGIGTAGQVLKVNSGATAPEWGAAGGSLTGCVAFTQNVSTSFTSGTSQIINYGSELFDTDGYHSTSTNTSRITIPAGKGGKYQIGGSFRLGGGTAGNYAIINVYKNGAAINGSGFDNGSMTRLSPNGNTFAMSAVGIFEFAAGDYVELAFQADTATGTYGFYSQFSAIYLGA